MPLKKGKSKKARNFNVKELISTFKRKGKIGNSKPKSKKAAIKQAIAVSYSLQRRKKRKST